jgi:hypothetical protein
MVRRGVDYYFAIICQGMEPVVLFQDEYGAFAPLHNCYLTGGKLISRRNTADEVYSQYCPQCLTVYSSNSAGVTVGSAASVKNKCPFCVICPLCASTVNIAISEDRKFFFECSYCQYNTSGQGKEVSCSDCEAVGRTNPEPCLIGAHKDELFRRLNDAVDHTAPSRIPELVSCFRHREPRTVTEGPGSGYYDAAAILRKERGGAADVSLPAASEAGRDPTGRCALPTFVPLLCKYTVRARPSDKAKLGGAAGSAAAAGSILVQAKASPLDGDSSNKLQRGKWWVKDATAVHEVPGICVRRVETESASAGLVKVAVEFDVTNPKEGDRQVNVRLGNWEGDGSGSWRYSKADPRFNCAKRLPTFACPARAAAGWNRTEVKVAGASFPARVADTTLQFDLSNLGLEPAFDSSATCTYVLADVRGGADDASAPVLTAKIGGYVDELLLDEAEGGAEDDEQPAAPRGSNWSVVRSHLNVLTIRANVEFHVDTACSSQTDQHVGVLDFSMQYTLIASTSPLRPAREYPCRILVPL